MFTVFFSFFLSHPLPMGFTQPSRNDETPTLHLSPVLITGTNLPVSESRAHTGLTVIPEERIDAEQEASATELLRHVPGLHIDQPGGRGGTGSVYIRGGDPNYTLVLIDGIRVNDPTNARGGSFDFSPMNRDGIERIEIVRGGFSPVYGSDAMAGVVHLVTRRGAGRPTMGVEISGGWYETYHASVQAQGAYRFLDYALTTSVFDNGKAVLGDRLFTETYHSKFGFGPGKWDVRSVFRFHSREAETFPDDSGGYRYAVIRNPELRESEAFSAGIDASHPVLNRWTARLHFDYLNRNDVNDSPGVAPGTRDPFGIPPNDSDNQFRRLTLRQDQIVEPGDLFRFTIGVEEQWEEGEHEGHLLVGSTVVPTQFRLTRSLLAPFAEFQTGPWREVFLTAGVRWDVPEDYKAQISHRVGLSYTLPSITTKLTVHSGEGFKLPSFFALGNPIVGNPALFPEKSRNFDFGIEQLFWKKRAELKVMYFYNRFKGAIDLAEGPPPRLVNRSEIVSKGFEAEVTVMPVPDLDINSHVTFLETDIKNTDEELRNRPKWRGGVALQWRPFSGGILHLDTLYVGEVLDSSIPTGDRRLEDYVRVDLAMTWKPRRNWEYFLSVDNLFDADYEEAVGFPSPGILPRIGVQAVF